MPDTSRLGLSCIGGKYIRNTVIFQYTEPHVTCVTWPAPHTTHIIRPRDVCDSLKSATHCNKIRKHKHFKLISLGLTHRPTVVVWRKKKCTDVCANRMLATSQVCQVDTNDVWPQWWGRGWGGTALFVRTAEFVSSSRNAHSTHTYT